MSCRPFQVKFQEIFAEPDSEIYTPDNVWSLGTNVSIADCLPPVVSVQPCVCHCEQLARTNQPCFCWRQYNLIRLHHYINGLAQGHGNYSDLFDMLIWINLNPCMDE